MIKLLLADNQPAVHYGINAFLQNSSSTYLIESVSSYNAVLNCLKTKNINVLLIDLELNGLSDIKLLKAIKNDFKNVKIIVYTNLSEDLYAINLIKSGASAFVHKTQSLPFLANVIEKVALTEVDLNRTSPQKSKLNGQKEKTDKSFRKLSNRELEVLRYLADGKKNKEIAAILKLDEKTVSTYKLRLLAKLHVTNLIDLVNKSKMLNVV